MSKGSPNSIKKIVELGWGW